MERALTGLGVGLALQVFLTGCGHERRPTSPHPLPPSPLVSKADPGQFGGRLLLAGGSGPKNFNPLLAADNDSDGIVRLLFNGLLYFEQTTQEPGPGLAESWSVESDQTTWTFKLRRGLRWSDGHPLTAADVAFTWNEIMYNPQFNRMTYGLFQVHGKSFSVTNLDEITVRVVTPEPYAAFLELFAGGVPVLPRHALQGALKNNAFSSVYGLGATPRRVIGSGPYRLKEVRPGKLVVLEPNPEFWIIDKQGRRLPYLDEIRVVASGRPASESSLFLAGKADVCEWVRQSELDLFQQATAKGGFQLLNLGIGAERDFLWFNQNTNSDSSGHPLVDPIRLKWFREKKFRQAVSCAIDRDQLVKEAYGGRGQPAYSFISTENPKWNNPNVPRYGFDLARAQSLLNELGMNERTPAGILKDDAGHPVEIQFISNVGNPMRERSARIIQQNLKRVGINLLYNPVSFEVLRTKVDRTFDYECALMGLGGGGIDPARQMNVLRSSEELHQWFPFQKTPSTDWETRLDGLMDSLMGTLDFAKRKKAFDEAQAIIAEELPMIYTVSPFDYAALRPALGNLRPSLLTPYRLTWNVEEIYLKNR